MKIIADENIPYVEQAFASLGEVKTLAGRSISSSNLSDADVLLVRSITQVDRQLLKDTTIKFVATATSGIDHIDVKYLHQNKIAFAQALGSNAISVAQYVLSGICYWSLQQQKTLNELSVGIIGYGNVGTQVEKLCVKLGIKCIINDPILAETSRFKSDGIEKALACDIVSLHVPLTHNGEYPTYHLINQNNIKRINPNGLLINTARGGVVDESAVLSYRQKYKNFSIILDVWENEPDINTDLLAQTLIVTPHIAGYSFDGKIRGTQMIYQACCQYFKHIPTWSIDDIDLVGNLLHKVKQSKHRDIRLSILEAYNIVKDHRQFKGSHKSFDNLRKDYPIRREWVYQH